MTAVDTRTRIIASAMDLFWRKGFAGTSVAEILARTQANSGSLYHFFTNKEDVLLGVLETYRQDIGPMLLDPAWDGIDDPIERIFALLERYRTFLTETDCTYGCPIGSLSLELHEPAPPVREALAANFRGWAAAIRDCLDAASNRFPDGTDLTALAELVLVVMEGAIMQARTHRDIACYDRPVLQLRSYFDMLMASSREEVL